MTDRGLHRLLVRAGVASTEYWRSLFFEGCRLDRNQLVCPTLASAEQIERLFAADLRRVVTDLEFRTEIGLTPEALPKALPPSVLKKHTPQKFWS